MDGFADQNTNPIFVPFLETSDSLGPVIENKYYWRYKSYIICDCTSSYAAISNSLYVSFGLTLLDFEGTFEKLFVQLPFFRDLKQKIE